MAWMATVISTTENPVPNDSVNVVVRFTDGARTFDKSYKVTNAEGWVENFLTSELTRVEANYAALQQLPDISDQAIPHRVENFQFRLVLHNRGSLTAVNTFLQTQDPIYREAWERANYFYRNGGLITLLRTQFTVSEEELDQMFIEAAAIVP
jgi:hypothetical protein